MSILLLLEALVLKQQFKEILILNSLFFQLMQMLSLSFVGGLVKYTSLSSMWKLSKFFYFY